MASQHHLKSKGLMSSSGGGGGITNNNYYGFSPTRPNDNDPALRTTSEVELAGGGLSFVIHSPSSQLSQQQQPSLTSFASSSGISSGSSTITKSSTFNGNTFTRSKPKERKPLPESWQENNNGASSPPPPSGPLKGAFLLQQSTPPVIPKVTLSEATPQSSSSSAETFFFNNSDDSSGGGSVVHNNANLEQGDHSPFQPQACSTFILTEGEEFPDSEKVQAGSAGRSIFFDKRKTRINKDNNNGDGPTVPHGITKMKVDISSDQFSVGVAKGQTSASGGASANNSALESNNNNSSPNGSSSGIHSNFSGEEENFECVGEGSESFTFQDSSGETSLQYSRDGVDLDLNSSGVGGGATTPLSRNSWTRTSLRKSPQSSSNGEAMGYRRWGSFRNAPGTKRTPPAVTSSNALANQLYRSSSFHSSGRSSAGDAEEMYSDGSLEDEVIDLTHKVHHLEEKMNVLAENQNDSDDRYTREKEKNAELSTKVFMLEEQLRETELRGEDKLREEQRRLKEFQSRWEREKQLQSENCEIRLHSLEKDLSTSKSEGTRLKGQLERERAEKENLTDKLIEMERELGLVRDENRGLTEQARRDREQMAMESAGANQALIALKTEVESMRQFQMQNSPASLRSLRQEEQGSIEEELIESRELKSRLKEHEEEIKKLKRTNQHLQDSNDELNAQLLNRGLEEGRTLLTTINSVPAGDSLAAEFEAMSQDQNALGLYAESETDLAKVKKALKEQVEVNEQLRAYIDGILLIIVENNPQLLEVKNHNNSQSSNNNKSDKRKSSDSSGGSADKKSSPNQQQPPSNNNRLSFSNGLSKIAFRK